LAGGGPSADWNCSGLSPDVRFVDAWPVLVAVSCVVGAAAPGGLPVNAAVASDSAVLVVVGTSCGLYAAVAVAAAVAVTVATAAVAVVVAVVACLRLFDGAASGALRLLFLPS
jgi:hypothetical protein